MPNSPRTAGVHHVGLTVRDLAATRGFFVEVLGFGQVGERPDYPAAFLTDGTVMITLWQAKNGQHAAAFDRHHCVGLHHLALGLADDDTLEALHDRLASAAGVDIEFAPTALGTAGARHLMCTIPGGVRVEFVGPAPTSETARPA